MPQNLTNIQQQIQTIIDLIAQKNSAQAALELVGANEKLDELIDFSDDGNDLMELSRFQVLLNHLQQKNEILKIELN